MDHRRRPWLSAARVQAPALPRSLHDGIRGTPKGVKWGSGLAPCPPLDPLESAWTEGLPASSPAEQDRSDLQRPYYGCPCHQAPAGRSVRFINGGPPGHRSLTRRVSLKTGFRFRFFTAVLRLLCLSGRR